MSNEEEKGMSPIVMLFLALALNGTFTLISNNKIFLSMKDDLIYEKLDLCHTLWKDMVGLKLVEQQYTFDTQIWHKSFQK